MGVEPLRLQLIPRFDRLNRAGNASWKTGGVGRKLPQRDRCSEFGRGADGDIRWQVLHHGLIQVDHTTVMKDHS